MNTRPFEKKSKHKPDDWINSTINIAVNILSHRNETINNYLKNSMEVNELITRELLGRTIWKYSEAYGKFEGCPFWSVKAYDYYILAKSKKKKRQEINANLRHEHIFPQILLINKIKKLKKPTIKIVRDLYDNYAIATIVTKDENDKLNKKKYADLSRTTIDENNIWLRYNNERIKIKVMKNPLENRFYKHHYKKMQEAKVF
jgi:hypothetical protein